MRYHRPADLWLEVKDNDYYSLQLREMSIVSDLVPTGLSLLNIDAIIRDLYVAPIIEDLNRTPYFGGLSEPPPKPKRKLHVQLAETRQSPEGKLAFELGFKAGYWPCLEGPFIAIALGYRRLDIWYGKPSYWPNGKPA